MEQKMVTIPFDLETAKRIREGKIPGQIVTEKGRDRAEPVIQVASQKRVSWSERRILQPTNAKMGRSRNVRDQEKNDHKTER